MRRIVSYLTLSIILVITLITPTNGVFARNDPTAGPSDTTTPQSTHDSNTPSNTSDGGEVTSSSTAENGTEIADDVADLNVDLSTLDTSTSATGTPFSYTTLYTFTKEGHLKDTASGVVREELWNTLLEQKEKEIKKEIEALQKDKFQSSSISIDLDTKDGKSYWSENLDGLLSATSDTIIRVKGTNHAYIKIPKAEYSGGELTNEPQIRSAIDKLKQYKKVVKEAIMMGTVSSSYNVYRMFPEKQVNLTDILELNPDRAKDGNMYVIKDNVGKMNYSLVYYFHPVFGKVDATQLDPHKSDKGVKNDYLLKMAQDIDITAGDKDKGSFAVDQVYLGYIRGVGLESNILSTIKKESVEGVKLRVNEMKTSVNKESAKAGNLVESVFPILTMTLYKESAANLRHFEMKEEGYKIVPNMYISIKNNYIMTEDNGGGYTITGGYPTYGVDLNSLVLVGYTDKDGGDKKGGVTSLWYKEAIYDFDGTLAEPKTYITGRMVRFNNDYAKKMKIDETNVDLLAVMTNRGGNSGVPMRHYAFGATGGDYATKEGNSTVGKNPDMFKVETTFTTDITGGVTGFVIYRNYNYWNEDGLIKHLETQEGMAGTDVEYAQLLKLIRGTFNLETAPLTFEEWLEVERIKQDLDKSLAKYATSIINIICLIFGVLLFFYSIIIAVAYLIDCVGFFETSVLSFVTMGRMRSIPFTLSEEEVGMFSAFQDRDTKYVTWKGIVIYFIVFGVISIIFLNAETVLQLLVYIYLRLSGGLTDTLL